MAGKHYGGKYAHTNKESALKQASPNLHPEWRRLFIFNEGSTIYFESALTDDMVPPHPALEVIKYLARTRPDLGYYFPERPNRKLIVCEKGAMAELPHCLYKMSTRDGTPIKMQIRTEDKL